MRTVVLCLSSLGFAVSVFAATDVRVDFTLHTTDVYGAPLTQNRYYYVYRPDGLSQAVPVPVVLAMETVPGGGPYAFFHRKADQAGFVVVSCSCATCSGLPEPVSSHLNLIPNTQDDGLHSISQISSIKFLRS